MLQGTYFGSVIKKSTLKYFTLISSLRFLACVRRQKSSFKKRWFTLMTLQYQYVHFTDRRCQDVKKIKKSNVKWLNDHVLYYSDWFTKLVTDDFLTCSVWTSNYSVCSCIFSSKNFNLIFLLKHCTFNGRNFFTLYKNDWYIYYSAGNII